MIVYICSHAPISIHSTARVETCRRSLKFLKCSYFNPLHREGGDDKVEVTDVIWEEISIHSTARVETVNQSVKCYFIKISIHSTARVETEFHNLPH